MEQHRPDGLFMSQSSYSKRIVKAANMDECKLVATPLPLAHPLYREHKTSTDDEKNLMKAVPYRQILCSLIFLSTRTRPKISTAVSLLGKFQTDPTTKDWQALKHLLRYLKATADLGILFPAQSDLPSLDAWSDAYWARDETKHRSR